jgi:hypothetical protein
MSSKFSKNFRKYRDSYEWLSITLDLSVSSGGISPLISRAECSVTNLRYPEPTLGQLRLRQKLPMCGRFGEIKKKYKDPAREMKCVRAGLTLLGGERFEKSFCGLGSGDFVVAVLGIVPMGSRGSDRDDRRAR